MDFKNFIVKENAPYPEIVDADNNPKVVKILKNLMSSNESELTAILQYFYQSSVAKNLDKNIASVLEEISIVEMMHLEQLSNAIVMFGGNPRYESAQGQFFSTSNINYTNRLREMLDRNIELEQNGIEAYRHSIEMVENKSLKELFERIIKDEKLHIKIFKQIKDNVRFMSY